MAKKAKTKRVSVAKTSMALILQDDLVGQYTELKARLLKSIESSGEILIDASGVHSVGTAAIQLLAAFVNRATEQERTVRWHDCSEEFLQAVRLSGLHRHLGTGAVRQTGSDR